MSKICEKIVNSSESAGWWTSPSYTYTELFSGARRPRSAHAHALGTRTGPADLFLNNQMTFCSIAAVSAVMLVGFLEIDVSTL